MSQLEALDIRVLSPDAIRLNCEISETEINEAIAKLEDKIPPDITVSSDNEVVEGAAFVAAAKRLGKEKVAKLMVKVLPQEETNIRRVKIADLKPHPINIEIYGIEDRQDLDAAIAESNWVKPLGVSRVKGREQLYVFDGNSRYNSCLRLGIKEVIAEIKTFESELEEEKFLLLSNVQRKKTIFQQLAEAERWRMLIQAEAKKRQANNGKAIAEEEKGTTRDKIADHVGLGTGPNYEKARKVWKKIIELEEVQPDNAIAQQLREALTQSVNAGFKLLQEFKQKKDENNQNRFAWLPDWKPTTGERVQISKGEMAGKLGTVTAVLTEYCLLMLDDLDESQRVRFSFSELAPLQVEEVEATTVVTAPAQIAPLRSEPPQSVREELTQKAEQLGLPKTGPQVLPTVEPNQGFDERVEEKRAAQVNEAVNNLQSVIHELNSRQVMQLTRQLATHDPKSFATEIDFLPDEAIEIIAQRIAARQNAAA